MSADAAAVVIENPAPRTSVGTFLLHIHRLRGIAILMIVALHCTAFLSWTEHPSFNRFLRELLDNSTVLFFFVSGFLFQHLSRNFSYPEYLAKKFRNVLLPYFIVATPAIAYTLLRTDIAARIPDLENSSIPYRIVSLYLYGGAHVNYALWFMPVLAIYYLAAPLMIAMDRKPQLYWLLPPLLALSIVGHRPIHTYGHNLQLALYFLSSYLYGMFVSHYRLSVEPLIRRFLPALFALYVALAAGHLLLGENYERYQVSSLFSFERGLIDWVLIQKLVLTTVLLGALSQPSRMNLGYLDYFADISLTIYLVHVCVLLAVRSATHWVPIEGTLLHWLVLYAITLSGACTIAFLARRLLGKWSRAIAGS